MSQRNVQMLPSAARTASQNSHVVGMHADESGAHIVIDVTAVAATPSVVPTVEGYDSVSGKWYDILVGVAITATGTTVLKVGPGIGAVANGAANDFLPAQWRVAFVAADADSMTYSVAANVF